MQWGSLSPANLSNLTQHSVLRKHQKLSKQYSYFTKIYLFNQVLFRHTQASSKDCWLYIAFNRTRIKDKNLWFMWGQNCNDSSLTLIDEAIKKTRNSDRKLLNMLFPPLKFCHHKMAKIVLSKQFFELTSLQMTSGGLI